jgi:selenocysteine lyase/cysteine desulfurase
MKQERHAGIITFRHPEKDNRQIYKRLQEHGILCAQRAGGIRFSPHFYTPRRDLERTIESLEKIINII